MKRLGSLIIIVLLQMASFYLSAQTLESTEYCQLELVVGDQQTQTLALKLGSQSSLLMPSEESLLRLSCSLNKQSVFSLDRNEILDISSDEQSLSLPRLASTAPSFLMPAGQFTVEFNLTMHNGNNKAFKWQTVEQFVYQSLLSTITMGVFYGLCMVLILYVSFMGKILSDKSFQLYSLYVFCASTFFLLQEGHLNIFLPESSFLLDHHFYIIFAGLTILSATIFITRITEIHQTWPRITRFGLYPAAIIVMVITLWMLLADHNALSVMLGKIMSRMTLLIMLVILLLVMVQTYRGVKMAWLVCVSLLLMFVAMVLRILPVDLGDFLARYGLIIAFAIEAFIFAIVVSSRLERIKIGKQLAESEANTDSLCNILNRRGWLSKAELLLRRQNLQGGVLGLLYIDLNDFKKINDTHGHDCGDKVLIIIAKIIQNQARAADVVGRIGGDEFVVLGHFDSQQESHVIALRLDQRLHDVNLHIDEQLDLTVSASVGHMSFTSPPESVNMMLSLADKDMYQKKRENRLLREASIQVE